MLTGVCSAVIVCVVSVVLYCMFKRAVFTPARSVNSLLESVSAKKKSKKPEAKKSKKLKKQKPPSESSDLLDQDKTQTSEETVDDEDSISADESERKVLDLSCVAGKMDDGAINVKVALKNDSMEALSYTPQNVDFEKLPMCEVAHPTCPAFTISGDKLNENADVLSPVEVSMTGSLEQPIPVTETQRLPVSSIKRIKRRSAKRATEALKLMSNPSGVLPTPEHSQVMAKSSSTDSTFERSLYQPPDALLTEAQEEVRKLTDQLRASDQKLQEVAERATRLSEENEGLRAKEEEQTLGLHVLQNEYRELLRTNKSIEHDKHLKDTKLQSLETERATLRARLDQTKAESSRLQTEADREIRDLRDQLAESKAKLASMAAAMAAAPPPGPTAELVRAQEMTQTITKENCLLKSRLEQLEGELNQLRQTNVIHQQEIQAFRVETRKLHAEKETALEELRVQRQAEQADAKSRIAGYEAQIQRQHHELEVERKRSQELLLNLNESQNELTRCLEHQKHQSEVISSLEYQFAELNAQKQRLFEEVTQSISLNEGTVTELQAQVAQLSNDLTRVTAELQEAQHRAGQLKTELDAARVGKSLNDVTTPNATAPRAPCPEDRADAGVCTESILDGDGTAGGVKSSSASGRAHPSLMAGMESKAALDQLREQLNVAQDKCKKAIRDRSEARKQQKVLASELTRYKNTLMETEYLLSKLQEFVGESEQKWRHLLIESENERNQLAARLEEANKTSREATEKLKEFERKPTKGRGIRTGGVSGKPKKNADQRSKKANQHLVPDDGPVLSTTAQFNDCKAIVPHQMDTAMSLHVVSPKCADETETSFMDAVAAVDDRHNMESMDEPTNVDSTYWNSPEPLARQRLTATSKHVPTECEGADTPQLVPPLGSHTDNDFDAVIVDDTYLHVPDDIWNSATKPLESSPTDNIATEVSSQNSILPADRSEPSSSPYGQS